METPPNVVPFRPIGEPKSPTLTPVENSAFDELARQLSARLDPDEAVHRRLRPPRRPRPWPNRRSAPPAPEPANGQWPTDRLRTNIRQNQRTRLAGAARAAGARRGAARPDTARSVADGHIDLPARPAALRQSGVPQAHRLRKPACAGAGRRPRRALCRTRRLHRQQHVGGRHPGDDFREPRN